MEEEIFESKAEAEAFYESVLKSVADSGWSIKIEKPKEIFCPQQNGTCKKKWCVEYSGDHSALARLSRM